MNKAFVFVVSALSAFSFPAQAEVSIKSGPALSAGLGFPFAGYGVSASYYVRVEEFNQWIVPYVSAGAVYVSGSAYPGWGAGMMGNWGTTHKAVILAGYASDSTSSPLGGNHIYAVNAGAGYEYMSDSGFFARPMIGLIFSTSKPSVDTPSYVLRGSLGVGYKF